MEVLGDLIAASEWRRAVGMGPNCSWHTPG
jgi:hypothetical protein